MEKCHYGYKCLFGKQITAECEFKNKEIDKYIFYLLGSSCCQCGKVAYAYYHNQCITYKPEVAKVLSVINKYYKIKNNEEEYNKYQFLYELTIDKN